MLFPEARANLSEADQKILDRWEAGALAIPPAGPNVVANVNGESHLVGNPPEEQPSALQAFLLGVVARFATLGAEAAFRLAAADCILQGRLLGAHPDAVYRFLPMDTLGRRVAQANGETSVWDRDRDRYVTDLLENWQTFGRERL